MDIDIYIYVIGLFGGEYGDLRDVISWRNVFELSVHGSGSREFSKGFRG